MWWYLMNPIAVRCLTGFYDPHSLQIYIHITSIIHTTNYTHGSCGFRSPRMHLFHIPQCSIQNRNVKLSVLNVALWDMKQVHSGICQKGQLDNDTFHPHVVGFFHWYWAIRLPINQADTIIKCIIQITRTAFITQTNQITQNRADVSYHNAFQSVMITNVINHIMITNQTWNSKRHPEWPWMASCEYLCGKILKNWSRYKGIALEYSYGLHQATASVPQLLPWLINPLLYFPRGNKFCITSTRIPSEIKRLKNQYQLWCTGVSWQ